MIRFIVFITISVCYFQTYGQVDSTKNNESIPQRVYSDGKHTAKAIIYTFKRPLSWEKKNWLIFGGVVGVSIASSFLDEETNSFFKRNQSDLLDPFATAGDFIGEPENQGPFLAVLWGSGIILNNNWMRETGSMIAATMATSGLLTAFGKEAFGRARPSKKEGSTSFKLFAGKEYHSLPSAHTSLSIASAWVLARQVKPLALKIPFYTIPIVVGWSRLYDNAHWLSDIVVSSALSIASAEAVLRYYSKHKKGKGNQEGLTILPRQDGISITYQF